MASNPTPDNNDILRAVADGIADGCHAHEVSIGIKQNTEATIRATIASLGGAETLVGTKKAAVADAYDDLQEADVAGTTCIANCKLRLQQKLGLRWSAAWEPTGFPNQSLAVPSTQDERFTLVNALKAYFIQVPAHESADMEATAAICDATFVALSEARQAVSTAESELTAAFNTRTAAADALRRRVRGLIGELESLISNEDPRWELFGLNIPANPTAPEPVASVTVAALGNGRLELDWPYATRATRYKIERKIVGLDPDFTNGYSAKDLQFIFKALTPGQTVQVRVVATNDGGDAAASPVASAVVT